MKAALISFNAIVFPKLKEMRLDPSLVLLKSCSDEIKRPEVFRD